MEDSSRTFDSLFEPADGMVQHIQTPFEDRTGSLNLVVTGSMGIVDGTMNTVRPTAPWGHFNGRPFVEMNFILEGNLYQTHEGILDHHLYARGYHNLLFNPSSWEENELISQGAYRIFGVYIAPEKMMELLSGYVPELAPFADKIDKGQPFVLHGQGNVLSRQMKYIFDTIWQCPEPLGLRKLYLESKVLELLSLQLLSLQCETSLHKNAAGAFPYGIGKTDIDRTHQARDILLKRLADPPSLTGLSRLCGLNEFKLKKYFVQLFGTSVFGFVQSERLEAAKNMIYQGEKNISEIAYHLGYAHPQHFHRAFKKKFGRTPGGMRK